MLDASNAKRQTPNYKRQTINNKQQTINNKHQTNNGLGGFKRNKTIPQKSFVKNKKTYAFV